jgi:hypothetical protein
MLHQHNLIDSGDVVVDKPLYIVPGEVRCPRCFGKDIVPSMPRGWRDTVMGAMGRIPRHCRFCEYRFYVRVSPRPEARNGVVEGSPDLSQALQSGTEAAAAVTPPAPRA